MDFVVKDKLRTLKFNNFSHFQNVISNNSPTRERYYDALSTKTDMSITPNLIQTRSGCLILIPCEITMKVKSIKINLKFKINTKQIY